MLSEIKGKLGLGMILRIEDSRKHKFLLIAIFFNVNVSFTNNIVSWNGIIELLYEGLHTTYI